MADRGLYNLPIPDNAQELTQTDVQRQLSSSGAVGGSGLIESITLGPNDRILQGGYRARYNAVMGADFERLFSAPDIESVPYYHLSGSDPADGYYALDNVSVEPADPRGVVGTGFDGVLTKKGTRRSHYRALDTTPQQPEGGGNDFGSDTTAYVGVNATASKVRWFDPASMALEQPSLVATRAGESADIEIYDAEAASFDDPVLVYELDYGDDPAGDVHVYDDRGHSSETDNDGVVQWAHVFSPDHVFDGRAIVDTDRLRLTFDEANNQLSAERWDDANGTWTSVTLDSTGWQLYGLDLYRIGLGYVEAQTAWEDTSDGSLYYLDMVAHRGYENAQWFIPPNESGPVPSGLKDRLDSIANTSVLHPHGSKTLQARSEVRR